MGVSRGILLLLFFLPLIYWLPVFNPYENPKFGFFIITIQALITIYFLQSGKILHFTPRALVTSWWRVQDNKERVQHGKKRIHDKRGLDFLTIAIVAFGLINLIADVFGIDPKISLLGSEYRHQGFVTLLAGIFFYFLVRSQKISLSKDNPYIKIILASTFFVCLFALWQGIAFYVLHDFSIPTYQGRIVGTFGNPNFLAGYLAMVLPLILCHYEFISESSLKNLKMLKRVQHDKKWILFKPIFVLMILTVIFFTGSRSGILATGAVLTFYFLYRFIKLDLKGKILVSLTVLILFFGAPRFEIPAQLRMPEYQRTKISNFWNARFSVPLSESSMWENRNVIWTEGYKAFLRRPLLGYGQENFELAFPEKRMMRVDNAHNIFLEVLISSGIMGLLIFIFILYSAFKRGNLTIKMSLVAFLVAAQFNPLSIAQIAFFWFLLGISSD